MKLISYELNEVPWVVIDEFVKSHPHSCIAKILNHSAQYTTVTRDSGELHPWSTWPTIHRGVYNKEHHIFFLNQKINTPYKPVWEILSENNLNVGVFGSLQSWPIPEKNNYCFYIPDTFAQSADTYPHEYHTFQKFNLEQTRDNGGSNYKSTRMSSMLKNIKVMFQLIYLGLNFSTIVKIINHLRLEFTNPLNKTLRPTIQAPISFDFYFKLLRKQQPDFSSFFTNHVAGIMHRYWKYAFPNDFDYILQSKRDIFLAKNIEKSLLIADSQLKKLKKFCDKHGYHLLIASSMGQEAILRTPYYGELRITDPEHFIEILGFKNLISNALAMQPDFAFVCESQIILNQFIAKVEEIKNADGTPLFSFKISENTINLSLKGYTQDTYSNNKVLFDNKLVSFDELGISKISRDPGTGYHQPYGIAIFYGEKVRANPSRQEIESIQILPTILDLFNIKQEKYMAKPLSIC